MKQLTTSFKSLVFKNKIYTYVFSFSIPVILGLLFFLYAFTSPELPESSLMAPFSKEYSDNIPSSLTYEVSDNELIGIKVQDVTISKMEQTKGLFTKNLNMSVVDNKGNIVALVLTDVKDGDIGFDLTSGVYFGNEHQDADKNYSIDLGTVVFSNSSNLIFEGVEGSSMLSRKGWIEIDKCKDGILSGAFEFEIMNNNTKTISKGEFENVPFSISK